MAPESLKPMRGAWAVVGLLLALLVALHLMSNAVQDAEGLSRMFVPLLIFVVSGLAIMVVLILVSSFRLWQEYRRQAAGSRLTLRMLVIFMLLSLSPVAVVYYYSVDILLQGIDRWFDVDVGAAVDDSLALSQASMDLHKKEKLRLTTYLWQGLQDNSQTALALSLDELRESFDVQELLLLDYGNNVIASSSANPTQIFVTPPENEVVRQVRDGQPFVALDPGSDGSNLMVRVVVADPKGRRLLLQALYSTSEQIGRLSDKVQNAFRRYQELEYLRDSLKFSFGLTLLLVLIYALVTAIWSAFFSARRLVAPVAQIADGTREVALGNYDQQLPIPATRDELGFLVASFNAMTRSIALARDMAERSQKEVESQRSYLQTVLGRLSSGVLTFDSNLCLRTANPAAQQILKVDLEPLYGAPLNQLYEERAALRTLVEALEEPLSRPHGEWRDEVTLFSGEGRQVLLCSISPMAMSGDAAAGHVLMFDDVTTLLQAQKDAAWGGVARRLAHEIKNPLTPIQLSAERLRHKFLGKMAETEGQVLDRATRTIIQQVEAMKEMVNAFSDYARPPKMQAEPLVFDRFINEALDLYRMADSGPPLSVALNAGEAQIEADPTRLRQVVINLVKNAQEALEEYADGHIEVYSRLGELAESGYVELEVRDNGPGFSDRVLEHLFEPYMTTKAKGTGLGLAIVKKIIEEHGGIISAENLQTAGAHIVIHLPLRDDGKPMARRVITPIETRAKEGERHHE
jgi:nitrogen fixation/metabolism regulation signal transduction histidine kinase